MEEYALALQERVNLGKADRPERVTFNDFISEHEKVMKGRVAHATVCIQMQALRFFKNYIGSLLCCLKFDHDMPRLLLQIV